MAFKIKLTAFICCCMALFSCSPKYTVLNKGIGGNSTADLVKRLEKDVLAAQPDLVIIMAGTNDIANSRKLVPSGTILANYRSMIVQLKAKGITVVLMSPPPVDTGYLFQRHDRRLFKTLPNERLDSLNTLLRQLAEGTGAYFIGIHQLFVQHDSPNRDSTSLICNALNSGKEDGVHPTREGYRLMAATIAAYLRKKHLLRKKHTIICFGDSITYGAFMTGAGTTEGDTYPAFLQQFIQKKHSL